MCVHVCGPVASGEVKVYHAMISTNIEVAGGRDGFCVHRWLPSVCACVCVCLCVCCHAGHILTTICHTRSRFFDDHCPNIALRRRGGGGGVFWGGGQLALVVQHGWS